MKSVVLLSSGLDSTVNFCKALREGAVVCALTFDYGQKAAASEILHAKLIAKQYGVRHEVVDLQWLKPLTQTALVQAEVDLPQLKTSELDDLTKTKQSARQVWVPNRNGVFIQIAASFAEALGAQSVVVGFNGEEAKTFPDNSASFVALVNQGLQFSTLSNVQVVCYTLAYNKKKIVQLGRELKAPFDLMWSCYQSGMQGCGRCESCLRYERAMKGRSDERV
ncbi:MAG: 7-cyano-7-deazaguanine synthase QueC [Deltaproteobacteria bacterium]|nr:7-cyano-7-deazaguanine synthase QueC [Deltaproteobacteria bacterium]